VNQSAYPGGAFPAELNPSMLDDNIINTPGWMNGLRPADIDIDGTTPEIDTTTSILTYTSGAVPVAPNIDIIPNDAFGGTIDSVTVAIVDHFDVGDILAVGAPGGLGVNYVIGTGVLTLTGNAPVATYKTALASLTFSTGSTSVLTRRVAITGIGKIGSGETTA